MTIALLVVVVVGALTGATPRFSRRTRITAFVVAGVALFVLSVMGAADEYSRTHRP